MILQHPTINHHDIAVTVSTRLARQVQHRPGEFFLVPHSLPRHQTPRHLTARVLPRLAHRHGHVARKPARRNDVRADIMRHEVVAQVLHEMVQSRFTRIVKEAARKAHQPSGAADGDDLARRRAFGPALVACIEKLQECHGCGEGGRHVCFEDLVPDAGGAVVEVIVPKFGD